MAQTKKPTTDLAGIIRFSELLALTGKKERYVFTAAVEGRPLGSNQVKTLKRTRDLIAAALDLLPDREVELLAADKVIVSYMPEEREAKAFKKKATRESAKPARANTAAVRKSK